MPDKFILLDIDGVMVPAASWKPVELNEDGFYKFAPRAEQSLDLLLDQTGATIILISSHRNKYNDFEWKDIFHKRLHNFKDFQTLEGATKLSFNNANRCEEILQWVNLHGNNQHYVIIDDDKSLHALPKNIQTHWIRTEPLVGLTKEKVEQAVTILNA